MSDNEENPPTTSGPNGRVATDGYVREPQLPADGAPEAPADASEIVEDRTTPANGAVHPGESEQAGERNGSAESASAAEPGPASAEPESGSAGSPAPNETAVFPRSAAPAPSPLPRPRPDVSSSNPVAREEEPVTQAFQPGSVPTPPPWRRASGTPEVTETATSRPTPRQAPVDSLLSEAPTAYLDRGGAPSSGQASFGGLRADVHAEVPAVGERAPRQALLQVKRFDPWSVLKLALVLAVVLFFIWLVAVGVLYGVLDGMGVWDRLNGTYADLVSGGEQSGGGSLISAGSVFGIAAVIGAVNSLLFAVAMTVGAFVYNVSADLVGGVEVTLSERD
ncbi:DUF3566 domain-containing protein [Pseudonocardia xishanensis]|uniref:DUF3566 domain-containing protein n=1 Tax=Pseudonocardia xishanensis TaxID=630995 RepID=A0ABP8RMN8_9PSEU